MNLGHLVVGVGGYLIGKYRQKVKSNEEVMDIMLSSLSAGYNKALHDLEIDRKITKDVRDDYTNRI